MDENKENKTTPEAEAGTVKEEEKSEEQGRHYWHHRHNHHNHHHHDHDGFDFGRLLFGVVILLVGLSILGHNTGWFSIQLGQLWRFWPVIIIIWGLSLISGRRGWLWNTFAFIFTLVVLAAIAIFAFWPGHWQGTYESRVQDISVAREQNITAAQVDLNLGAAKVNIGGESSSLISGTLNSNVFHIVTDSTVEGNLQKVVFREEGNNENWWRSNWGGNNLVLRLSTSTPMDLSLHSGASDMSLDLASVQTRNVNVDTGASSLNLILGNKVNQQNVVIKAGASSLNITIPKDTGVKMTLKSGLSSRNFESLNKIGEDLYQSSNYDQAPNKIDLTLQIGVSSLNINRE